MHTYIMHACMHAYIHYMHPRIARIFVYALLWFAVLCSRACLRCFAFRSFPVHRLAGRAALRCVDEKSEDSDDDDLVALTKQLAKEEQLLDHTVQVLRPG